MKLLKTYQQLLSFAFVRNKIKSLRASDVPNVNYEYPLGLWKLIPLFVWVPGLFLLIISLFRDDIQTFQEYSELIYSTATVCLNISNFITFLRKRARIFQFIDMFESEIEKRKLTSYTELRRRQMSNVNG